MATRDSELFKETIQVSLDGRQIFCLFAGGAVIASLVFVLGVMVGRRVESRAHPERAAASGKASDPLAALDQIAAADGDTDSELAFASALRGEHKGDPLGAVDVSLEKKGRTRSDAVALTGQAPVGQAGGDASDDADQAQAQADADDDSGDGAAGASHAGDDGDSGSTSAAAADASDAPAAKAAKPDKPTKADGPAQVAPDKAHFTLQLSSFQSKAEAESFRQTVSKAGYAPYLIQAEVEGKGTWYRIRIGYYRDYDDAIAAKKIFEKKQKIIAYVTRIN